MSLHGKNKIYLDETRSVEERAKDLLSDMSLEEKMAQINCVFPFDKNAMDLAWIADQVPYGIGEVSTLEMRRISTLQGAAQWVKDVQTLVMEKSPHHIPAIFHMEGLCGAFIQEATSFPSGIARGASFNPDLEEEIGSCVAKQELACGITHILAPVLDISRDSRMGRQGETYGEDPALASAMGVAYTKGIQETSIDGRKAESVAKHFLAFHNSQGGIHGTHSDTPERLLQEIYGKPFQAAIREAGLKGIMPCYCSIDGEPASLSHKLLTGLLRDEMGFDGLCISDYGGIENSHNYQRIGETMAEAGESLTAENLNALYLEMNKKYFGPDMVSDDEIAYEWARIPHFYYNFYVYQYATGFSSAVALAHGILKEGAPAVERYKKFLSGGCSESPVELLKIAGVNLETPKPIQEALDVFGETLDEMEALVK